MRNCCVPIGCLAALVCAVGCSSKAPRSAATAATQDKETFASALATASADPALTDEQALRKFAQISAERAEEFHLLKSVKPGATVQPADGGGWAVDLHVRDMHSLTTRGGTPDQVERLVEQDHLFTLKTLANMVTSLLEKGKNRSLKFVRVSVYTPAKVKSAGGTDEAKEIMALRVRASQGDYKKIIGWYLWPNFVPDGYGRDAESKKKLENEMWTVEVNEYPKIQSKKR